MLGLSFDRPRKTKKTPVVPSAEEKNKYFQESQAFASALAVKMEDPIGKCVAMILIQKKKKRNQSVSIFFLFIC